MKKGKLLEQIIKAIQEMVNDSKYTKVSSNALLKDKNGIMREIDVLVVCEQQHVKTSTALECKEYKRKVGITVVDALIGKYIDLPTINNKILIARNGFSEPAKEKAKANGVPRCRILDRDELIAMEPNLSDDVVAALHAPTGAIVCPFHMTMAFAENANVNGVSFFLNTEVKHIQKNEFSAILRTSVAAAFQSGSFSPRNAWNTVPEV